MPASGAPGTTAAAYLKMFPSARPAALGGSFVGVANDPGTVFYNPAGLRTLSHVEFMLSHMELVQGMHCESLVYVQPLQKGLVLGFSGELFTSGPIGKYNELGDRTGTFSAAEGMLGASIAGSISGALLGGVTVKALHQGLDSESALTGAVDAGLLYSSGRWRFGASAQNFGPAMKLGSTGFELPRGVKAGALYRWPRLLSLSAQLTEYLREDPFLSVGAEIPLSREGNVMLRSGYRTGMSSGAGPGLSFGVGLRDTHLEFSYALSPMGDLGMTHNISFSYKIGNAFTYDR